MKQKTYELRLLVSGKPIQEYDHKGSSFVEGRKGSSFEVEFKNNSAKRVLVIPSVDGVSTLDGQPATPDSKGYLVKPYQTLVIPGWTVDSGSAAKFVFQDKDKSYAAESVRLTSAGVIGVLVYAEKEEPKYTAPPIRIGIPTPVPTPMPGINPWTLPPVIPYYGSPTGQPPAWTLTGAAAGLPYNATQNTTASLSASATIKTAVSDSSLETPPADDAFGLGTGWGKKVDFKVNEVQFNKGDLDAQLVVYYDTRRNLEKRGIEVVRRERTYLSELPQAFQGIGCRPPPDWRG